MGLVAVNHGHQKPGFGFPTRRWWEKDVFSDHLLAASHTKSSHDNAEVIIDFIAVSSVYLPTRNVFTVHHVILANNPQSQTAVILLTVLHCWIGGGTRKGIKKANGKAWEREGGRGYTPTLLPSPAHYEVMDKSLAATHIIIIIIIIIIYLPTSSTHKQQVQSYNTGRTTRQRTAVTAGLNME